MENENVLDQLDYNEKTGFEEFSIISPGKFILLSLITFGMYEIWWTYKAWRFFKEKDKLDIYPVARTIFGIFFLTSLFERIKRFAEEKAYPHSYTSFLLFVCIIIFNVLGRLPQPYWLISFCSIFFMLQPFNALNYAILNSEEFGAREQDGFSGRQIVLLVVGGLFWALVILGLMVENGNLAL